MDLDLNRPAPIDDDDSPPNQPEVAGRAAAAGGGGDGGGDVIEGAVRPVPAPAKGRKIFGASKNF